MSNRKNTPRKNRKEDFFDKLHLPTDVMVGEAVAMVFENRKIQIQNVKGMIECTSEKVVLLSKRNKMEICGKRLEVNEYSKEEIIVKGNIEQIIYLEKQR